jgi:transposase
VLADQADDAQERVIVPLIKREIQVVIPSKQNRLPPRSDDHVWYQARHRIENGFAKLKQFRGIATRDDKCSLNFLGGIYLAASVIWLA